MFAIWYSVVLVLLHQARDITASVTWPGGKYALPKPESGCPEGWADGSIKQYTLLQTRPSNNKSDDLHMAGSVSSRQIIKYFCIKVTSSSSRPTWPKGEYCIYSMHKKTGNIHSSDYYCRTSGNQLNIDSFIRVNYRSTNLYFLCRTSGNKKIPISLPITQPFYLLPFGSRDCQQVKWMVASSEWIKDYTFSYNNQQGQTPRYDLKSFRQWKELKMYYCYYKSCKYTRNDTRGVFQSPGFPGEYPDGQLCSWMIMVPANHTLVVNFTKFSLYEHDEDSLQLYEYNSKIFKPKQAYFGRQQPFTITATSDLMFVFRSDEKYNSNGFSANYTILKTPEITTTSKPPTTTTPKPTTKLTTTQPPPTTLPTTKRLILTEAPTTININSTTNETGQCNPIPTKDKSYNKHHIDALRKKTCFCDETWRIVVTVIPLAVFILIVPVIIDIFCRCRSFGI